jgi:hypothetical protein
MRPFSRRAALRTGAGMAAAMGLGITVAPSATAAPPPADPGARVLTGQTSANGWEMQKGADIGGAIWTRPVAGTECSVAVHIGDVEVVLVHVIRRFHYEIGTVRAGEVVGFLPPGRTLTGYRTNHASGTAVDIRPGWYPVGTKGNFTGYELTVVRDILADCAGVVTWGGDFRRADEAHFQIDVPPGDQRLTELADRIRGWNSTPGLGAGVLNAGA